MKERLAAPTAPGRVTTDLLDRPTVDREEAVAGWPGARWYRPALIVIMLLGLVRGLFWLAAFPYPTVDEPSHLSEIESIAHGHYPVEGRAPVSPDVLRLMKEAPLTNVIGWRSTAVLPTPTDPRWRLAGQNYEADQPPLYYAVMVPFYWLGRAAGGILGALFTIRLATLILGLLAVPLLGQLARRLFPSQPAVWWLAPAVLVVVQIFTASIAIVDNDVLTTVFGLCCLLLLQRAWKIVDIRGGLLFGVSLGLAVLSKGTALTLAPLLAMWIGGLLWIHRSRIGHGLRWLLAAVAAAAVLIGPWIAWNEHAYHRLTGASAHQRLRSQINAFVPFSWSGVQHAAKTAFDSLWIPTQLYGTEPSYQRMWHIVVLAGAGAAVVLAAVLRRYRSRFWIVASLALALPLGLEAAAVLNVASTHTIMEARYLDVLVPVACLLVAWSVIAALGAHLGTIALVAFLALSSVIEVRHDQRALVSTYQTARYGSAVPVVDQSYATTIVKASSVSVTDAPCNVRYVSLHLSTYLPAATIDGETPATLPPSQIGWTTYQVPGPGARSFNIVFEGPALVSAADFPPPPGISLGGSDAAPLIRLYCTVSDPDQFRFHQTYAYQHPFPMSWSVLYRTPDALAVAVVILAAGVVMLIAWDLASPALGRGRRRGIHARGRHASSRETDQPIP